MEKFTVPQFIDVEDKIMGPITVRQFVIMMVGAMMLFLGYKLFTFTVFVIWGLGWLSFVGIVGFLRVNGKPFHFFLLNLIETFRRPSIRVWDKKLTLAQVRQLAKRSASDVKKEEKIPEKPYVSQSTLSELALIADTGGSYEGEHDWQSNITFSPTGEVITNDKKNKGKKLPKNNK